jgi:hypothetical protein
VRPDSGALQRTKRRAINETNRRDVVESSLLLSRPSGRIFVWVLALGHHEDGSMRLLHANNARQLMKTKLRKLME